MIKYHEDMERWKKEYGVSDEDMKGKSSREKRKQSKSEY